MKRTCFYIITIFLACSCQLADLMEQGKINRAFTASLEEYQTKTYVEEGRLLRWNEDDRISLFEGNTLNAQYRFDGQTGDNSGTFSSLETSYGTGNDLQRNYAIYPYKAGTEITESGVIYFYLPNHQKYANNSFGLGANTMACATKDLDDTYLSFKNVCGYIKVQLYGSNIKVRRITFSGNNGEHISGEAKINISETNEPSVSLTRDAESVIVLDCGESGVEVGNSVNSPTSFWIVVPPKTFTKGFNVTILTMDGAEIKKSTTNNVTIERNIVTPMKAFEIFAKPNAVPDYQWYINATGDEYYINRAEELLALSKLSNGDAYALSVVGEDAPVTFEGKTVNLTSDLDLRVCCSEQTTTSWEPINGFMGTMEGNGHSISNLYCNLNNNMGLFNRLTNAKICDLRVDGKIYRTFLTDDKGQFQIGGFAAYAYASIFENCTSNVIIETSGTSETCPISLSSGGICGTSSSSSFIACRSFAYLDDYQGEREYGHYIGGIIGYAINCNVIACINHSEKVIQSLSSAYCYVGGIVGYIMAGDGTMIRSCYSSTKVEGRQPGQILGAIGTSTGTPNIQSCYYSGPSYKGIGSKFYGGYEYSYDYGTQRSTDLLTEVTEMNLTISKWNTEHPEAMCNYMYIIGEDNKLDVN